VQDPALRSISLAFAIPDRRSSGWAVERACRADPMGTNRPAASEEAQGLSMLPAARYDQASAPPMVARSEEEMLELANASVLPSELWDAVSGRVVLERRFRERSSVPRSRSESDLPLGLESSLELVAHRH
ncbi:MAG: hypothetical protein ACR2PL_19095, partial [Dehalococcoidia bacterium]